MDIDKIKSALKKGLDEKRYKHTIQTTETAVQLAEIYECDIEKARLAGLLHDCARAYSTEEQLEFLKGTKYPVTLAAVQKILHGPAGAILANRDYGVEDEDILNAIANHTCGRPAMSLLEKIIFIADAIEPDREFPNVEKLRKTAMRDLNLAVLMSLEGTRQKIEEEEGIWYEGSKDALEYYREKVKIRPGSRHVVDVINMTHEGRGVARIDDFVVFIEGAITGELVETKILHRTKKYAIAEIYKVIESATERVEPFCKVYDTCGGCSLQHLRYDIQLRFKQNYVMDCLLRIGGFKKITVSPTRGMKFPYHYRNKVQYPVVNGKAGFYKRRSHKIVEHRICAIQPDEINDIMSFSKPLLPDYIRHIVFRKGTEGVMMILVCKKTKPVLDDFVSQVTERFSIIKTVIANINTKDTNTILGDKNKILYGTGKIMDRLLGIEYTISPNSFYQVNKEQTRYLYTRIAKMANLKGKEIVYDLYCGIGSIGLYLAKKAKKVIGVESVNAAVRDARANARNNDIKNVKFIHGKAEDIAGEVAEKHGKPNIIVIDPPRKGCDGRLLKTILNLKPEKVIYVSCNPATLARDIKILCNGGYNPGKVQPIDMFPFTSHVETVVLLTRVEK